MYVIPITDPTMNPAQRVPVISLMNLIDHQLSLLLYDRNDGSLQSTNNHVKRYMLAHPTCK